jgi:hypothetical protein
VNPSSRRRSRLIAAVAAAVCALLGAGAVVLILNRDPEPAAVFAAPSASAPGSAAPDARYGFERRTAPDRTEVRDPSGTLVAIMTDGSRTAHLVGPERVFAEPRFTSATITHNLWARLAPVEWTARSATEAWFLPWLEQALTDRGPDVLAVAMQYVYGAKPEKDATGLQVAGDAAFGPLSDLDPDGRAENSDFYDYLGIPWTAPEGKAE